MNNTSQFKRSLSVLLFALILIASFILINITSGVLFGSYKLDLTQDQRYSLSKKTKDALNNVKSPIKVRIYVSPTLSKEYPLYAQYAQFVLRYMEQYRKYSHNKIQVEVINPKPFSNDQEDAKRYGLKSFKSTNDSENYYFGAVFSNAIGQDYTIPYFFSLRKNYLENDITRAITSLSNFKSKTIAVVSPDLPVIKQSYMDSKNFKNWSFINLLKKDYNVVSVTSGAAEIPYEVDMLLLVSSQKLSPVFIYALDQYVMRGGKVLIFMDPFSEVEKELKNITTIDGPNLNMLLAHWGIHYQEDVVIGDRELAIETKINQESGSSRNKRYPLWINFGSKYINQNHPITTSFNHIFAKSAGFFRLSEVKGITNTPLITTSDKTIVIDAQITKFGTKDEVFDYLQEENQSQVISVLSEGSYQSAFKSNPLEGTEVGDKLLPYLSSSLVPAKIIITADTDLLHTNNWAHTDYLNADDSSEIIPTNNNFDFIQRSVDYLTGNESMLSVGNKDLADRASSLYTIIHQKIYDKHSGKLDELNKKLERSIISLNTSLKMLDNQELSPSVKTLNDINSLRRDVQQSQEDLLKFEHIVNSEIEQEIDHIVSASTVFFPVLILLLIISANLFINQKNKRKARRLLDE